MPRALPVCLCGVYEVCSFLFLLVRHLVRFQRTRCRFFLWEVISGVGAVHGDVITPLRAHSIRGVATLTFYAKLVGLLRCWRPHLGGRIQFLPLVIYVMFNMLWKTFNPLAPL